MVCSQQQSQGTPYTIVEVVQVSTKSICIVGDPSADHTHTNVAKKCKLYVKHNPMRLVIIGRVVKENLIIHNIPFIVELDIGNG